MIVLKDYQCYVMYFLVGIITSIQPCVCHYGIFICLFIYLGGGGGNKNEASSFAQVFWWKKAQWKKTEMDQTDEKGESRS